MEPVGSKHRWTFFSSGGVNQVSLDTAEDLRALGSLDQKLWVALACPTTGLQLDAATLALIDDDKDGRIRAPEILSAVRWACGVLKDPGELFHRADTLRLAAINDSSEEGKELLASAKQILVNLGQADAATISVDDVADTKKIFAETTFNGDGVITADAAVDDDLKAVIEQIIECLDSVEDRSGKPGIDQARVDKFFEEAEAFDAWSRRPEGDPAILPLQEATGAAAAAVDAVRAKVEDYFARCRLAAFDARALEALNREEKEYLALAAKDLTITSEEIAGFPLARIEGARPLPLARGVNPAWAEALALLATDAVAPLAPGGEPEGETMGETMSEAQWRELVAKLAPHQAWMAEKAGAVVGQLGIDRLREILGSGARETITGLIEQDMKYEAEANNMAAVQRLVLYHRDLFQLLNNYVSFRTFYGRKEEAIFQAGTLFLDGRSCELCVRVEDVAKHAALAVASKGLLAYCDLNRKATGEKMSIVAMFTGGDSDYLFVGRNGIFYDRDGHDWDATIVKLVDNPVSIPQAIWSPYKKFIKLVESQIEKFAASKDKAVQDQAAAGVATTGSSAAGQAAAGKPAVGKPAAFDVAKFAGIFAAIGLAIGAIGGILGAMVGGFSRLAWWQMPLALLGIMVLISGPSVVMAWLKLRQRNIGPILDACGWAINSRAKINIPFGATLTGVPRVPDGSRHGIADAYAPRSRAGWYLLLALLAALAGAWYFGLLQRHWPDWLPRSGRVERSKAAEAARRAAPVNTPAPPASPATKVASPAPAPPQAKVAPPAPPQATVAPPAPAPAPPATKVAPLAPAPTAPAP